MPALHTASLTGLYGITDPLLCGPRLLEDARLALEAGVQILQYRNKQASPGQQQEEALALKRLCQQHGGLFIINDDAALAADVDADGVHLGQKDPALGEARQLLGKNKIIGISCNNRFDYALAAQQQGADYVAFGRFFASRTKPGAPQAEVELLRRARSELELPVVAIGGITPDNGAELLEAGAQMLAVIHGIFGTPDIDQAVRRYRCLFDQSFIKMTQG